MPRGKPLSYFTDASAEKRKHCKEYIDTLCKKMKEDCGKHFTKFGQGDKPELELTPETNMHISQVVELLQKKYPLMKYYDALLIALKHWLPDPENLEDLKKLKENPRRADELMVKYNDPIKSPKLNSYALRWAFDEFMKSAFAPKNPEPFDAIYKGKFGYLHGLPYFDKHDFKNKKRKRVITEEFRTGKVRSEMEPLATRFNYITNNQAPPVVPPGGGGIPPAWPNAKPSGAKPAWLRNYIEEAIQEKINRNKDLLNSRIFDSRGNFIKTEKKEIKKEGKKEDNEN